MLATHGGGRLWEFFCLHDDALFPEIGGANSTCLHHVLTLQHEAALGIPAVVHAVFGALSHPRGARDTVEFLLAAFLVACGEYQYVVISPSNSWRLRPDGRDFALHDEYRKRLGAPRSVANRNGTQFRRSFEHASVFVDVQTRVAKIDWADSDDLQAPVGTADESAESARVHVGRRGSADFGKLQLRGSADTPPSLHVVSDAWQQRFVTVSGAELVLSGGGNVKLATTPTVAEPSGYFQWKLLNKSLAYTVDLSRVGCSCNAALYLVSMVRKFD